MSALLSGCTNLSYDQVQQAFLAAPPLIAQEIVDLTVQSPSFLMDLPEYDTWPAGNGTQMQQLVFRGEMPQIERGFNNWSKLTDNTGCDPCDGPNCSYNWTTFGGTSMDRKLAELMRREFKTPGYCIKTIQTTAHFKEVFAKIVENIYRQTAFFKEQNIAFNLLTQLAKKFVVDGSGPKPNPADPYVYRNFGSARSGSVNILLFEFFYEWMRRIPDVIPYDVVDGAPIYGAFMSQQLQSHLYRDDASLRQDARFSGAANSLLSKYNFQSTIRGMFIPAPILYPRRFRLEAVTGRPIEVLPFVNGVPAEVGTYTSFNPAYEQATHEEILLCGRSPFKLWTQPTEETLGAGTSFGPEFSMFDNWMWINPMTVQDPFRRFGYFASEATLGISPQFSEGILGVLVERPPVTMAVTYNPEPVCPPDTVSCDNDVPDTLCPCPLILSYTPNPLTAGNYFITLAAPIVASVSDDIQFGIDTGGYVTGTVVGINAAGTVVEVTITDGTDFLDVCDHFTSIFCDDTMGCFADVLQYAPTCEQTDYWTVILSNPVKADVGEDITVYYGDGTSVTGTIISIDYTTNTYVLDTGAAVCDQVGGVVAVCVPTATESTCPGCGGPTVTQCET